MDLGSRPVGFLVVGTGFLGAQRAAAVDAADGARLVGVIDADLDAAEAVAARRQVEAFDDYEAALACPDVDAVIVATPHGDHFNRCLAALEAGKHVLCEKPLTIRPEDAQYLAVRADELRLRLATGFNHRFYPPIAEALELVRSWAVGRVEHVRVEIGHRAGPDFLASWHTDLDQSGGGTLMDNGPHACDLIRLLMGQVVGAKGYLRPGLNLPQGCEAEAYALFRDFDEGVAELRSSWTQPRGYLTLQIRGTDGWLWVETSPWHLWGEVTGGRRIRRTYLADRVAERLFRARNGCERSLVREIEAFVSTDRDVARRAASGWDGCGATEMIAAVYRSDAEGSEVRLKPSLVHLPSSSRRRALGERAA